MPLNSSAGWRRLLKDPWIARWSNLSILREINPEYSLEGLMLKLQHFGHLTQTDDSLEKSICWKRLRAEGEGAIRGWDSWTVSLMQWRWTCSNSGRWWGTGRPGMMQYMGLQRVGPNWATEQQQQKENSNYNSEVKLLSCVQLFVTPWTVAYQVPPSMGFSRQECWSGLPFPFPGDLPNPGIEPGSPA